MIVSAPRLRSKAKSIVIVTDGKVQRLWMKGLPNRLKEGKVVHSNIVVSAQCHNFIESSNSGRITVQFSLTGYFGIGNSGRSSIAFGYEHLRYWKEYSVTVVVIQSSLLYSFSALSLIVTKIDIYLIELDSEDQSRICEEQRYDGEITASQARLKEKWAIPLSQGEWNEKRNRGWRQVKGLSWVIPIVSVGFVLIFLSGQVDDSKIGDQTTPWDRNGYIHGRQSAFEDLCYEPQDPSLTRLF